jgi:hypothetical protein
MRTATVLSLLLRLAILGIAVLFTIQNMSRTSVLSLDLWLFGIQLGEPQPLPYLIWTALAVGLILGLTRGMQGRRQSIRRIRELEAELVRQELDKGPESESESESSNWT